MIGVLYGGLTDLDLTLRGKDPFKVPTNITYVVPAHYLLSTLREFEKNPSMTLPVDTRSIDEMLEDARLVNVFDEGRKWGIRQVDEAAESGRVKEVVRIAPLEKPRG